MSLASFLRTSSRSTKCFAVAARWLHTESLDENAHAAAGDRRRAMRICSSAALSNGDFESLANRKQSSSPSSDPRKRVRFWPTFPGGEPVTPMRAACRTIRSTVAAARSFDLVLSDRVLLLTEQGITRDLRIPQARPARTAARGETGFPAQRGSLHRPQCASHRPRSLECGHRTSCGK